MIQPTKEQLLAWINAYRAIADVEVAEVISTHFTSVEYFSPDWTDEEAEQLAERLARDIVHEKRLNAMTEEETDQWEAAGTPHLGMEP